MNQPRRDPEPLVRDWLRQPVDLPDSDLARIAWLVHQTPQQRRWPRLPLPRSSTTMFTALKLTAAGAVLTAVGLILPAVLPTTDPDVLPPGALSPSPSALSPVPSAAPVTTEDPSPAASPVALGPVTLAFEAGDGATVGGWTRVGQVAPRAGDGSGYTELRSLQTIADVVVAITTFEESDEGPSRGRVLVSTDGLSWSEAIVPGTDPTFTDLLAGPDGLVLAGSDTQEGEESARLWTSPDGITWSAIPAPGSRSIDRILSLDEPRVMVVGQRLWISRDGADWEQGQRHPNTFFAHGPSGFLLWQGGGGEVAFPLSVLHSADLTGLSEVPLPNELEGGAASTQGVGIFVAGDRWVMVPSFERSPDRILTSTDGATWEWAPRPAGMNVEELRWLTSVGDATQAFGYVLDEDGIGGVWTWALGSDGPAPALLPGSDEWIDEPVAFDGGHLATGVSRGEDAGLTIWRLEAAAE